MPSSASVKFSLMLPTFYDAGARSPFEATFAFAERADALGYHMGTFGHHSFTPEIGDPSAPFALLSAVAVRTHNLRLGTGVYLGAAAPSAHGCRTSRHIGSDFRWPRGAGCGARAIGLTNTQGSA